MRHNILTLIFLLTLPISVLAEKVKFNDTESTQTGRAKLGLEFNYKPIRQLSLGLCPEIYVDALNYTNGKKDNETPLNRLNLSFAIGYRPLTYFKLNADYTFMAVHHDGNKKSDYKKFFEICHRINVDAIGSLPIERWTLSLRERFRTTFRPDSSHYDSREKLFATMELRTRLKVEYKCFSKPLTPFFFIEMDNQLNHHEAIKKYLKTSDYWLKKMQYRLGLDWKLDAYSTLTFYYAFEHGKSYDVDYNKKNTKVTLTPEKQFTHILGVYYTLDF